MIKKLVHHSGALLGAALFAATLWVLHGELKHLRFQEIIEELHSIPGRRAALALFVTIVCSAVLPGYDLLGMAYLGRSLPVRRVAFASLLSYIFSNNVGLSVLGATAVRFRLYTLWGLSAAEVLRLVAFTSVSFWLGILNFPRVVSAVPHPEPGPLPRNAWVAR